ncbi:hypothetical protein [Streptomyces sp. NPDC047024]|uniref:hypothetical protein n=1 Tax=Streptomyces sp. NPDC047024 TaxID=3155476 RepID=UPI0033C65166
MDDEFVLAQDLSGTEGRKIEDRSRRAMLEGATSASRATVAGPAEDVTPPGSDVVVSCQVLRDTASGVELAYPACAWADGNTGAVVVAADLTTEDPADVDLDAAARDTLRIRTEMLRPVD